MTIPDFSATPRGQSFSDGRDIAKGLAEFNAVITDECRKRNILNIDLFALSQKMGGDAAFVSSDGFHPSAKGYAQWEEFMEPAIYQHLIKMRSKF